MPCKCDLRLDPTVKFTRLVVVTFQIQDLWPGVIVMQTTWGTRIGRPNKERTEMSHARMATTGISVAVTTLLSGCFPVPGPVAREAAINAANQDNPSSALASSAAERMEDHAPTPSTAGEAGTPRVPPTISPSGEPLPWGTWILDSGGMLPSFIMGLATFGTTADVTALTLNPDGTGRIFFRDRLTDAKDCVNMFALFDGDTLVLDFGAETVTDVVFNIGIEQYNFFFPVVVVERNLLGIADESGQIALFTRKSSLPAAIDCAELEIIDRFDGIPQPQFFSDLVLLNGDLVYSSGETNQIESFDPETDTLNAPLGTVSNRLVQSTEDGFLWTHCGCGGSRDAFKRTLQTVVDTVSSEDEMGGPITFRAMAYDPLADRLWIHGRPFDDQFGRFFVMNTNGEPDLVEQELSFNRDLRALAFDGEQLWGLVTIASQAVVRIDPTTAKVIETFEVPDQSVSWNGLVVDGRHMYMLGTGDTGGILMRLTIPPAPPEPRAVASAVNP